MSDIVSEAKQTLLRALDSITEMEEESGAEVRYVAVAYSAYREDEDGTIHDLGGWNHSSAPAWLITAMLRHTAEAIEGSVVTDVDGED